MAKQRRFKCAKCDRRFSMAAHLARHMSTMHASKRAKATKRGRPVAARVKREVGSGPAGVIASVRAYRDLLADQRSEIDNRIQAIGAALAAMGSGAAKPVVTRRKSGKGPRAGSLKDYIARVLRGLVRGKSVKDISAAVLRAGYKSNDKKFDHSVGKALADMNVTRVGRGVYRLK